jgi:hypothetical protein
MKNTLSLFILLYTAFALNGCKSDAVSTNATTPLPVRTMKATVSGKSSTYFDGATRQVYNGQSALVISGIDSTLGRNITLTLVNVTAKGTYNVGTANLPSLTTYIVIGYVYADATLQPQSYTSPIAPGLTASGSVTITQFDTLGIQGTFNTTVTKQSGNTGPATETITDGAFNAPYVL